LATIYQVAWHHIPDYCCFKIIIECNGLFLVTPFDERLSENRRA
jgi:hypothetical protein